MPVYCVYSLGVCTRGLVVCLPSESSHGQPAAEAKRELRARQVAGWELCTFHVSLSEEGSGPAGSRSTTWLILALTFPICAIMQLSQPWKISPDCNLHFWLGLFICRWGSVVFIIVMLCFLPNPDVNSHPPLFQRWFPTQDRVGLFAFSKVQQVLGIRRADKINGF